jgi:hypothetical protein
MNRAKPKADVDPWLIGNEETLISGEINGAGDQPVTVDDFLLEAHQIILARVRSLKRRGCLAIEQALDRHGELKKVGGKAKITEICALPHDSLSIAYALDEVLEASRQRQAVKIAKQLTAGEITLGEARKELNSLDSFRNDLPTPTSIIALAETDPAIFESDNLLGIRWLCREGGALIIAPSGIGKSSFGIQQDICFALGRPAFGIKPPRPLRILTVQAENDDGDLAEMGRGICAHLNLADEERRQIAERVFYIKEKSLTGTAFLRLVRRLVSKYRPDIIRIDPLHAYAGGDVRDPEVTTAFLRNGLNPILEEFHCAAIIMHHTPKTIYRDTSEWSSSDWMYAGAGNADLTNWARAILVIDATHVSGTFVFRAAKRGSRIGWADEHGEPVYERLFCHQTGGAICWRDAADDDAERVALTKQKKPPKTVQDLLALVPLQGSIGKNLLRSQAQIKGIGTNRFRDLLAEALESTDDGEPMVYEWRISRPRTNPEVRISRHEQTLV